jgi:isopentenyl-diphosphate delta-isomerase
VGSRLVEHEHNHVFVGTVDNPEVQPSAHEVSEWRWVDPSTLRNDVQARPQCYTSWFRLLLAPALDAAPTRKNTSSSPSASSQERKSTSA